MNKSIRKITPYILKPHKIVRYVLLTYATFVKWIPDTIYVKLLFWGSFGRKLLLDDNEKMSFNEKLQWLKLHDRNNLYSSLVDKYEFKEFIRKEIGEDYVIPTFGVWETFEEIDFDLFPNQFVLKCTHDSASALVCRDKSKLQYLDTREHFNNGLQRNLFWAGREWPYKNVKPRLIAEKYLEEDYYHT